MTARWVDVKEEEKRAVAENRKPRVLVSPEIQKLFDALALTRDPVGQLVRDRGKPLTPIPWVQVHSLPAFAYFDHRRHVAAGVDCRTCHGPVETMEHMRQHSDLSMGWCVNCHREVNLTGVNGQKVHASTDCAGCHY
ncbi:MAG: cytochrome c3 family protein [Candidatus Brocadiae bacterium]|nr:cytochrome c3 family protein [Candidatus Brocadiia bacterium]